MDGNGWKEWGEGMRNGVGEREGWGGCKGRGERWGLRGKEGGGW